MPNKCYPFCLSGAVSLVCSVLRESGCVAVGDVLMAAAAGDEVAADDDRDDSHAGRSVVGCCFVSKRSGFIPQADPSFMSFILTFLYKTH